ncbi:NOF-FB transposable element [Pseudolycoriella hygida]|uniref:NOF-FB transposable element n=1 Tax=Pseudolycoriella hygida TaxID=35572 RepID=A0A9Q0NE22_9DIPT|nr:NOF-FB transposable element [Pseudolycoriella hygida]
METGVAFTKINDSTTSDTSSDCTLAESQIPTSDDEDKNEDFSETLKQFEVGLSSLIANDKKIFDVLTKLAGANLKIASQIADIIIKNKYSVDGLLILYLVDSITKNVGQAYIAVFSTFLVSIFKKTFIQLDDIKKKEKMFSLRYYWNNVFPEPLLTSLDVVIHQIDRNWPILNERESATINDISNVEQYEEGRKDPLEKADLELFNAIYDSTMLKNGEHKIDDNHYEENLAPDDKSGTSINVCQVNKAHSSYSDSDEVKGRSMTSPGSVVQQQTKRQRGRPPNISKDDQVNLFNQNMSSIVINNKLAGSTSAVYYKIAEKLGLDKQAVYLAAKRYFIGQKLILNAENDDKENREAEYTPLQSFDKNFTISTNDISFEINISKIALFDDNTVSTKYARKLNSASVVRAQLADEMMMDHEEHEPALLPNSQTLQVQKFRLNKKDYLHQNPILAIRLMKDESQYFGCIMDCGLDPFFCAYVTPLQNELLRVYTRYTSCIISIDSSGVPVIPPEFSSYSIEFDTLKPIFLYNINLQLPTFSIPIFQLLSQRHTSSFLHYILSCWQDVCFGGKSPNEIIVDDSKALLLTSAQTFTSCKTMEVYMNKCYDALFEGCKTPECFIRLNRSHIVKAIKRNEYLKKEDKRRKILYQRIFGYLISVEDVKDAEKIIREIFILLYNKYSNDVYVSNAKKHLKTLSDCHLMDDDDGDEMIVDVPESTSMLLTATKFKKWLHDI